MATLLPPSTDITASSTKQGGAKIYHAAVRSFLAALLGTDAENKPAAREALGVAQGRNSGTFAALQVSDVDVARFGGATGDNSGQLAGFRNLFINGGAQVANRSWSSLFNDAYTYGEVDRCAVVVSATTVTSGKAVRATGLPTSTGAAVGASPVSTTGPTVVKFIERIASENAVVANGKPIMVSGRYYQNTGSPITVTVTALKPNTPDVYPANGSGVTQVGLQASFVAANGWTPFALKIDVGATDASGGLAVLVSTQVLTALSGREFYWGDRQCEVGSIVTTFEKRHIEFERLLCNPYYQTGHISSMTQASCQYAAIYSPFLGGAMRAAPAMTIKNQNTGVVGQMYADSASVPALIAPFASPFGNNGFRVMVSNATIGMNVGFGGTYTASAEL